MKKKPKKKIAPSPITQKAIHEKIVNEIIRKHAKMFQKLANQ